MRGPGLAIVVVSAALLLASAGCAGGGAPRTVITFPIGAAGAESEITRRQLARFMEEHPGIVVVSRPTPDSSDQRHQLYVQWLNARASDPDILQLDIIWTPEFAAAGWLLPLERFNPEIEDFFPASIESNRWQGHLYALPWFVDVGMLYWRTDLLEEPPATFVDLLEQAQAARARSGLPYGFVWQGARYEGLITVFLEILGGHGGSILDDSGSVAVDSPAAVSALTFLTEAIHKHGIVPESVLTWQEEQTRFAFQNGQAVFMRNWPYACALLQNAAESRVAGRFAVAPMPAAPGGSPTAALGGWQLAINANSDEPQAAYAVIDYLMRPEQLLERLRVAGTFPARPSVYDHPGLAGELPVSPQQVRRIIEAATPRPRTPVYTELSQILQIWLHRALTRQEEPARALSRAKRDMSALLKRVGLVAEAEGGPGAI